MLPFSWALKDLVCFKKPFVMLIMLNLEINMGELVFLHCLGPPIQDMCQRQFSVHRNSSKDATRKWLPSWGLYFPPTLIVRWSCEGEQTEANKKVSRFTVLLPEALAKYVALSCPLSPSALWSQKTRQFLQDRGSLRPKSLMEDTLQQLIPASD